MDAILSESEIETILSAAKSTGQQNSALQIIAAKNSSEEAERNVKANNILNAVIIDVERSLSSFLHKKVVITKHYLSLIKADDLDSVVNKIGVFTLFNIAPNSGDGVLFISMELLHQIINTLYGGHVNAQDSIIKSPGKVGALVAAKFSEIFLTSLHNSFPDPGKVEISNLKTDTFIDSSRLFKKEKNLYHVEGNIEIGSLSLEFFCILSQKFLSSELSGKESIENKAKVTVREKDFWRHAIKSEVIDSSVVLTTSLAEIKLTLNEFMNLKSGNLIEIPDPHQAYVCLNNIKLFRALVGQGDSSLVLKILNQI